jgi:N-acetylmuramoyl-L-alanine amidase CwlA|nr:MAG TPA: N-acetylmuramoyl-L-alanine amidase [Bacteriophage sp.]
MKMTTKYAKSISYGNKRPLSNIKYIVIHYTGNKGDTAQNNLDYFANGNTRQAGAHFFVDKKGKVGKSIAMSRTAWAVGGDHRSGRKGEAAYFGKCTNANSVSIELCDMCLKTNWEQMLVTRKLVKYIQSKCPNAKTVIRHWDVNGKECPAPFIGTSNEKWIEFKRFITAGYKFKARVTKNATLRSSAKISATNKKGTVKKGSVVNIVKMQNNFGLTNDGYWVTLNKLKEI